MILFSAKISSKHQIKLKNDFPDQNFIFTDNDAECAKHLANANVFVTYGSDVTEGLVSKADKLKWIMVLSAGVDELPFKLIEERGIIVTNSRGIHKVQMAEYAISMLLQVYRQEKRITQNENEHKWDKTVKVQEITGKTMVIAGTGAIGQEVARLAKAFRIKTIGVSRSGQQKEHFDENYTDEELDHVLTQADFIVSVLPSTKETKEFFKPNHFELMPNHSVFLNMGRGDAVTNETILAAVRNDEIAHAVLDVFEEEPLSEDHPFWSDKKITVTPHISGLSPNYVKRAMEIFTTNLETYIEGKTTYQNKIDISRGY